MAGDRELREAVKNALTEVIGEDAYDCIRVWEAWSVGTMTDDDFWPVTERIDEITDAVMAVLSPAQGMEEAEPVAWRHKLTKNDGTTSEWIVTEEEQTGKWWSDDTPIDGFVQEPLYTAPPSLSTRVAELETALEPFARLEVPKKTVGNAGAYSLRFSDIDRARAALSKTES